MPVHSITTGSERRQQYNELLVVPRIDDGRTIATGQAIVDPGNDKQLVLTLPPLAPGRYRVRWHVVSVDTHRTEGEYSFAVER